MNKHEFIEALTKKADIEEKDAIIINYILEKYILIGKKSKEHIITDIIEELKVDEARANEIYNTSMDILKDEIKDRLKHPFKDLDKED